MHRIAAFEKVSQTAFVESCLDAGFLHSSEEARNAYETIALPVRATSGSAGYDFFLPGPLELPAGASFTVPTGIRVRIAEGWVLVLCPKSGLGVRYRLQLDNTVGIIDSDYYYARNEGHILVRLTNDSINEDTLSLSAGKAFVQGIFLPFGITADDEADGQRTGGFGSTEVV